MKLIFYLCGVSILSGILYFLPSCKNKAVMLEQSNQQTEKTEIPKKVDPKNYDKLRNLAFNTTAEQIGIQLPSDKTKIYGVIMEWNMGDVTATTVSFLSGDASVYFNYGGGVIGGSGYDNIKQAAFGFINKAENYIDMSVKSDDTSLPEMNIIKFYFLTNKGRFVGQEEMKYFENNSSKWIDLFNERNKLMTEIRITSEKKQKTLSN